MSSAAPRPRVFVQGVLGAVAAAVLLGGCTGVGDSPEPTRLTAAPSTAPTPTTSPAVADADVEFVELLVAHHRQALALAALVPERTDTPEVVVLAQDITAARTPELQELLDRLEEWGLPAQASSAAPSEDVEGGLTAEQVSAIRDSEGAEFDRLWLEGMIEHHEGAIALAEDVLAAGSHRPTLTLAQRLVVADRAEITRMAAMLGG